MTKAHVSPLPILLIVVVAAVSLLASCPGGGDPPDPTESIEFGASHFLVDDAVVDFGDGSFTAAPVVVVSSIKDGVPLASAAKEAGHGGFTVGIFDLTGDAAVTDSAGTDSFWVAVQPYAGSPFRAQTLITVSDGQSVAFPSAFSREPAVICSAWDGETGKPLIAAPASISLTGMTVDLKTLAGADYAGALAVLSYIAAEAGQPWVSLSTCAWAAGRGDKSDGSTVSFPADAPGTGHAAFASASVAGNALATAGSGHTNGGFTVELADDAGAAAPGDALFSWMAFSELP